MTFSVVQADAIEFMRSQPEGSVDLVLGSPPYMDARTYDDGTLPAGAVTVRDCREWVEWMLDITEAAVRVSNGLVLWVVAGVQRDLCYWPGCEGLAWEWWKRGGHLIAPCVWWKVDSDDGGTGIPGSGGKQFLRKDWEYVLMFKRPGPLPWANPLVMGHEPFFNRVGGEMSNRTADGRRIKASRDPWDKHGRGNNIGGRQRNGKKNRGTTADLSEECKSGDHSECCYDFCACPCHADEAATTVTRGSDADPWGTGGHNGLGGRRKSGEKKKRKPPKMMDAPAGKNGDGTRKENTNRPMPKVANPGNVLPLIVKARVGGGHMGSKLCHENEAPYPEELASFFVQSFCPPGGTVLDPFSGSGTTGAVSVRHGRNFLGCDLRASQVELSRKRIATETPLDLFKE